MVNLFLSAAAITQRRVKQTQEAQIRSIDKILRDQRILREKEEAETRRKWEARSKEIWDQVDKAAIVVEARIEAERKAIQEEEDRIKREQEEKERVERERRERQEAERKRVEEEKKRVEEEKKQAEEAKRQAEEARKRAEEDKRKSEEQEAQRQLAEEARKKAEENLEKEKVALSHIEKERIQMGFTTPSEDWEATMDIINVRVAFICLIFLTCSRLSNMVIYSALRVIPFKSENGLQLDVESPLELVRLPRRNNRLNGSYVNH